MAKEDGATREGIENPAFNISRTDLSAYQTSEEKVIKHDKPDSTLAAHPQKLRLQACAQPRGVISILIMLTLSDSCCVSDLTWAFHSQHHTFQPSLSAHASRRKQGMLTYIKPQLLGSYSSPLNCSDDSFPWASSCSKSLSLTR
uniref:Uncharacterized protein n=1 Tax=Monodelphis domestica TaxID=13616 RepID=A0A5F8HDE1_MONDO